jgi:CRP-like cAMP-binding protein
LLNTSIPSRCDNRLLSALPAEALALLAHDLKQIYPAQGTMLLEPGEVIEQIYFPQAGLVSLLIVSRNGATVETAMVGHEGAVGLQRGFGQRKSLTRAVVQVPGRFSAITAQAFERASRSSPAIREMSASYIEVLWAEAQQITACNAIHDASSRLCRWLLQGADRVHFGDRLPLTQEFLAQMLGVRRTTVTLLAQELQKKGAIKYSRGKIAIADRPALEACACECYRIVQHERLPERIGVTFGARGHPSAGVAASRSS